MKQQLGIKYFQLTLLTLTATVVSTWVYAGASDHLARAATRIKHIEGNNVSTLSQYSDITYLVELIALGLVVAALLAVTFSIFTRQGVSKREQKKILSLRRSAEQDKKVFDQTLSELDSIGKKIKEDATEVHEQLNKTTEKTHEIEQRAEAVATIELDMKQLIEGTTERINHIKEYWEQQLKETTSAMNQINANMESGLKQTAEQSKQAEILLKNLSELHSATVSEDGKSVNAAIRETLEQTLTESKELLTQIKDYKEQARVAYSSFTNTLSSFESQAHEQFDDIFNTADIARQELNANLDESREYMKIFRKDKHNEAAERNLILEGIDKTPKEKQTTTVESKKDNTENTVIISNEGKEAPKSNYRRRGRPIIGMTDAEDLTDPSLLKEYGSQPVSPANEDKNLVSLFSKFRHS